MAGRKTILTSEIIEEIGKVKASGCTDKDCFESLGIHSSTWYDWRSRGEADEEANKKTIYSEFSSTIKQATAQMRIENIRAIKAATEWQAKAWLLERMDPENWGKRERLDINGQVPVTIVDDLQ